MRTSKGWARMATEKADRIVRENDAELINGGYVWGTLGAIHYAHVPADGSKREVTLKRVTHSFSGRVVWYREVKFHQA